MKKKKVIKNPSAKVLRTPTFRPKVIQSKKGYVRKKIKLDEIDDT
jgi:stalled ribosome alternative rescue factor ArfA